MKFEEGNQQRVFVHSQPVPRIFKTASKILKKVKEGEASLKNLVYAEKHVNIQTVYGIIAKTLQKFNIIDELIAKSEILSKEPRFDPWLVRILTCELLFGKNKLHGESKPIQIILSYEREFRKILPTCKEASEEIVNFKVSKPRYVRVNTLKITAKEAVDNFREEGWILLPFFNKSDYAQFLEKLNSLKEREFMSDPHIPQLLIFPPKTEFYKHPAYKLKNILLQDKASCLPVQLLNPPPGSTVLDMCAAPGMKTTQLAAMLNNSGTVYAVEMDINRAKLLRELVESTGATCVKTILKDVMQVNENDCPDVEYILVDPSCSGSGITDRIEVDHNNKTHDKMARLRKLSSFQAKLLRHALNSFPKAKRVIYSTCSVNSEENEDVVRQVLETCPNFKLINAKKMLPSWNNTSSEVFPILGEMCIYSNPETDKTNGFFIAVLERLQDGEKNPFLNIELYKMFKKRGEQSKAKKLEYRKQTETGQVKEIENDVKSEKFTQKNEEGIDEDKSIVKKEIKEIEKKHKRKKVKEEIVDDVKCEELTPKNEEINEGESIVKEERQKKKKHKKKKAEEEIAETSKVNEETLKKESKKKRKNKQDEGLGTEEDTPDIIPEKKKKKKHKSSE